MKLDDTISKRHSVRNFTSKKPDWRDIIESIDAARLAPSAGNIPTLKFILVEDKQKIAKLTKACQQDFISQSQAVVVFCSDSAQSQRSYGERALRYAKQQAGASIQNFWLKLVDLGLATCWIGAFDDDSIKHILEIPDNVDVEAIFPIGYELGKVKSRPKHDLSGMIFFDTWKNKWKGKMIGKVKAENI